MEITDAVKRQYKRARLRAQLEKLDLDQAAKEKVLAAKEKIREEKSK